jgi:hypothetical protein
LKRRFVKEKKKRKKKKKVSRCSYSRVDDNAIRSKERGKKGRGEERAITIRSYVLF